MSMLTEWINQRETEAAMEVGLTGSTLRVGKPRTWGSGEAEGRTDWGNIPYTQ